MSWRDYKKTEIEKNGISIEIELFDTTTAIDRKKLIEASFKISEALKGTNLSSLTICEGDKDIAIKGLHKEIVRYYYGDFIRVKKDLSNLNEAVDEFVKMWLEADTPERLNGILKFIEDGEKYGWD